MAYGWGNTEGIPSWENEWKGRATQPISQSRIGVWRHELGATEVARLERWGGRTLEARGYELTVSRPPRLPIWLYPKVCYRAALWLATRPRFGDARGVQAGNDLVNSEGVA